MLTQTIRICILYALSVLSDLARLFTGVLYKLCAFEQAGDIESRLLDRARNFDWGDPNGR
jgi:hypothetical protein